MKAIKKEAKFEQDLKAIAPLFDCLYFKIPDVIPTKGKIVALKRPFDSIIVTALKNYLVECKIDYAALKPHQKANMLNINKLNSSFVVLRKIFLKSKIKYRIEINNETFETSVIADIFKLLNGTGKIKD